MVQAVIVGAFVGALAVSGGLRAQEPLPSSSIWAQATTVEGCLRKGIFDGELVVTSGSERYTVVANEGVDVTSHINHQVQLTGTVERVSDSAVLHVSALKMLGTSCTASD